MEGDGEKMKLFKEGDGKKMKFFNVVEWSIKINVFQPSKLKSVLELII